MWNHALVNNYQSEWRMQLCWKIYYIHFFAENSWILESRKVFNSISKYPTAVLWVTRSIFSAFHSSPSLKSFKPLTGSKGLGVSMRLSRMLNSRNSLDRSTSWNVTSQESTLYAGFLLQSRSCSSLDWCDNQTPSWSCLPIPCQFAICRFDGLKLSANSN